MNHHSTILQSAFEIPLCLESSLPCGSGGCCLINTSPQRPGTHMCSVLEPCLGKQTTGRLNSQERNMIKAVAFCKNQDKIININASAGFPPFPLSMVFAISFIFPASLLQDCSQLCTWKKKKTGLALGWISRRVTNVWDRNISF